VEAHQSLDVLGYRCQDELLPHELQSAQAQATTNAESGERAILRILAEHLEVTKAPLES
jgi:hypothetical protein